MSQYNVSVEPGSGRTSLPSFIKLIRFALSPLKLLECLILLKLQVQCILFYEI